MTPIADPDKYVSDMHHSLVDKMFFTSIINPAVVVDYGCADGELLRAYERMFPSAQLVGYDCDLAMTVKAREQSSEKIIFSDKWSSCTRYLAEVGPESALVLSSVLHEIESYCSSAEKVDFYRRAWYTEFKYVVVRDMMVSESIDRPSSPLDVARARQMLGYGMVREWEEVWGPITGQRSLLHLLLTYRYTDNWTRELRENYLGLTLENFMDSVPSRYRPIYFEHYTLPFVRKSVEQDLGINITDRTHIKAIFERVK